MTNPTPPAAASDFASLLATLHDSVLHCSATDHERGYMLEEIEALSSAIDAARTLSAQPSGVVCTCPSGDGSLRWPCPQHPAPPIAQQGGVEVTDAMVEWAAVAIFQKTFCYTGTDMDIPKKHWENNASSYRRDARIALEAALTGKADGGEK